MSNRVEKVSQEIAHIAADFIARESNHGSLITVTRAEIVPSFRSARIYVSVMPESQSENALHFLKRQRSDLRAYVKSRTAMKQIPYIDIELDQGEKRRQRLDEIGNELKNKEASN